MVFILTKANGGINGIMPAIVDIPEEIKNLRSLYDAVDSDNPTKEDRLAFQDALEEYPDMWRAVGNMAKNAATNTIYSVNGPESLKLSLTHGWHAIHHQQEYPHRPQRLILTKTQSIRLLKRVTITVQGTRRMGHGGKSKMLGAGY